MLDRVSLEAVRQEDNSEKPWVVGTSSLRQYKRGKQFALCNPPEVASVIDHDTQDSKLQISFGWLHMVVYLP